MGDLPIFPCGLIANSVFNGESLATCLPSRRWRLTRDAELDTFLPPVLVNPSGSSGNVTYNMTDRGIVWPGEAKKYTKTSYKVGEAVPPPNWAERYPEGYTEATGVPDLSQDEHLQVWMRTAGLPTFRKLYFRNDDETMEAGEYEIEIYMSASPLLSPSPPFSLSFSLLPSC